MNSRERQKVHESANTTKTSSDIRKRIKSGVNKWKYPGGNLTQIYDKSSDGRLSHKYLRPDITSTGIGDKYKSKQMKQFPNSRSDKNLFRNTQSFKNKLLERQRDYHKKSKVPNTRKFVGDTGSQDMGKTHITPNTYSKNWGRYSHIPQKMGNRSPSYKKAVYEQAKKTSIGTTGGAPIHSQSTSNLSLNLKVKPKKSRNQNIYMGSTGPNKQTQSHKAIPVLKPGTFEVYNEKGSHIIRGKANESARNNRVHQIYVDIENNDTLAISSNQGVSEESKQINSARGVRSPFNLDQKEKSVSGTPRYVVTGKSNISTSDKSQAAYTTNFAKPTNFSRNTEKELGPSKTQVSMNSEMRYSKGKFS